jgi:hypothetical protein
MSKKTRQRLDAGLNGRRAETPCNQAAVAELAAQISAAPEPDLCLEEAGD